MSGLIGLEQGRHSNELSLDGMIPISHWSTLRTKILNLLHQNHFVPCLPSFLDLKWRQEVPSRPLYLIWSDQIWCDLMWSDLPNFTSLHPRTFGLSLKSGGFLNGGVIKLYRCRHLNYCLLSILSLLSGRVVAPILTDIPSITATANSGLTEGTRNRYPVGWCVLSCLYFIITGWECLCYRQWCHVLLKRAYATSLIHSAVLWSTSLNRMLHWRSYALADSFSRRRSPCLCTYFCF